MHSPLLKSWGCSRSHDPPSFDTKGQYVIYNRCTFIINHTILLTSFFCCFSVPCDLNNRCQNGADCTNNIFDAFGYTCSCPAGYTGHDCDSEGMEFKFCFDLPSSLALYTN